VRHRIRELATEIAAGRLDDTTPQHPLEAYQLLIDILHEHDGASAETGHPSKQE
jgi:hypothetical protein